MIFSGGNIQSMLMSMLLSLPGIVIALSFHEFAHAWVSDKLGDPTPRAQGRLTISPLAHVDPLGIVMLLFLGFGYGKAVQIDPTYYKNRRVGQILVSLAGVTMNFLLALVFTIIFCIPAVYMFLLEHAALYNIFMGIISINIALMVFNLMPIPPLDGYKVVKQVILGGRTYKFLWYLEQYGIWILLAFLVLSRQFNIIGIVSEHVFNFIISIVRLIL